jgi:predicted aspartyl protease
MTIPNIASAQALTQKYTGLSNVLYCDAWVSEAFAPGLSPGSTDPPIQKQFRAIWDTGATNTAISENVINSCALKPTGMTMVNTANGPANFLTYFINLILPSHVGFYYVKVTQAQITGADMLIGMDIMCKGDLAVTNKDGNTAFSFRIPSCDCIDFVQQINISRTALRQIRRNDPCPCGSGKKYKHCCGK